MTLYAALAASILVGRLALGALAILGLGARRSRSRSARRVARNHRNKALPIAVTAGYVGSIAGPLIVGRTAQLFSRRVAVAISVALCISVASAASATGPRASP